MKPSNNWISTLIKLIQECPSETGQSFRDLFMISGDETDESLIKYLKGLL